MRRRRAHALVVRFSSVNVSSKGAGSPDSARIAVPGADGPRRRSGHFDISPKPNTAAVSRRSRRRASLWPISATRLPAWASSTPFSVPVDQHRQPGRGRRAEQPCQKISPAGELLASFGTLGRGLKAQFNTGRRLSDGLGRSMLSTSPTSIIASRSSIRRAASSARLAPTGDDRPPVPSPGAWPSGPARGDLYVADTDNNRVVRYLPTSPDPLPMGQKGSGPDQFLSPGGVAVDRQGNVFVADTGNRRILRLAAPRGAQLPQSQR